MPRKKAVPPAKKPETNAAPPVPEKPEANAAPPVPEAPETPPMPPSPAQGQEAPDFADPGGGQAPDGPGTPPAPEGRPAVVTAAKGLNLREGPGFGFAVRTALKSGAKILILDLPMDAKVPGWELADAGGTTGWVCEKHLRVLVD